MSRIKFPLIKPYITKEEEAAVLKVLRSGWLTEGDYVKRLEEKLKTYNKVKNALLLNSATSGLIAGVASLKLDEQDEVIVPSFTFPSTANSVMLGGGKPVFCDIDLRTFNILPESIEESITKHTKAIIVVHEFGLPAEMDHIMRIASEYNLFIIEDAACALGSEYNKRKTGTFGDIGVFSFHPRKIITSGEGGCVTTNSSKIAKEIECLRNHGEYKNEFISYGYNFRLSDIQAAVLLSQFERIEKIINRRIELALHYNKLLKPLEDKEILGVPCCLDNCRHIYQSYVVVLSELIDRDKLKGLLRQKGIETQFGTYCLPLLAFYSKNFKISKKCCENAYYAYKHTLTLPLYHTLKADEQAFIVEELTRSINKCAQ